MSQFSLDDIRAAAEAKFGHMDITLSEDENVRLINVLRLPKEKRELVMKIDDRLDEEGADQGDVLADLIRTVSESEEQANKLIEAVGDDLSVLIQIFSDYTKGTQVGEA